MQCTRGVRRGPAGEAERRLRDALRRGPGAVAWRDPHRVPLGVADGLYCADVRLAVEVEDAADDADPARVPRRWLLRQAGVTVVRLGAADVLRDPARAADAVRAVAARLRACRPPAFL